MNLFHYESKFMQLLGMFADMVIMNALFVLCSLPIFTIGAAQAGLFSGLRVLVDKDNDEYCYRAFFKGFANGFKRVTIVWCGLLVLMALMVWSLLMVHNFEFENATLSVWLSFIALAFLCIFSSVMTSFHAKFDCTAWQLVKNTWFTVLGHPIRSIALGILVWLPAVVFVWDTYTFIRLTLILITMYYSVAFLFCNSIMNKHYQHLVDRMQSQEEESTEESEPSEE